MQSISNSNRKSEKNIVGIDISDGSLELANLKEIDKHIYLHDHARVLLDENTIIHGLIHKPDNLADSIKQLFAQTRLESNKVDVITALPDAQVIVKHIPITDTELPSFEYLENLKEHATDSLSLQIKKPIARWQYATYEKNIKEYILYVTDQKYVRQWNSFFRKNKMRPTHIEMESLALSRALIQNFRRHEQIGILDFGLRTTSFSLMGDRTIRYSRTTDQGGYHLTTSIAGQMHISMSEAETQKQAYGLTTKTPPELKKLIENKIDQILTDLDLLKTLKHCNLSQLLITGGGAKMPGLRAYISKTLKRPVTIGKLWIFTDAQKNIKTTNKPIAREEEILYAGAIGLALSGLGQNRFKQKVNFLD